MILLNMAGLARPARIAANSSRVASTDLSIFSSASWRMSLITVCPFVVERSPCGSAPPGGRPGRDRARASRLGGGDERANLLTLHDPQDVALLLHAEHDQRKLVLHAQGERRGVGDAQVSLEGLLEGEPVELGGA